MWRERLKVPILIIATPLAVLTLHVAHIRPLLGLALTCSKEHVDRSYAWGDTDILGFDKFPSRPVQNAAPAFHFKSVSACDLAP
jgi:hypothetical protein